MNLRAPHLSRPAARGVTILELLVAVSLISFIILVLYQMFNTTQLQMRKAVRDTDKFESGRAATDLLRRDLVQLGHVKAIHDAGVGGIATNWGSVLYPPVNYVPGYYPAGSLARLGVDSIIALANTTNVPPAFPWTYAAPNFRISAWWDVTPPLVIMNTGSVLQVCARHDLFFMYFDPDLRVTGVASGGIQPGVSYVATNALTYGGVNFLVGDPFYGWAGFATYGGGGVRAVQVEGGWRAVGYRLADSANASWPITNGVGTLYRFELATLGNDPRKMWMTFTNFAERNATVQTNAFKRVVDNVVHFKCQAVVNGSASQVSWQAPDYPAYLLFGTNVPSRVDIEFATLDPKIAKQAEGIGGYSAITNYLSQQGSHVQLFRLQVPIRIGLQ